MTGEHPISSPRPTTRFTGRLLIIGGGITGLSAALRAGELAPQGRIDVWETRDRWGGVLHTEQTGPYLIEHSADNFLAQEPWGVDFARRTGFASELIPTNAGNRRASVLHNGNLVEVPEGFVLMSPRAIWPMLKTPLLSWRGKLRMLAELFIESRPTEVRDESLQSFAVRRFGREAFERLIQPLIGGIYTADPQRLSLAATLPRFLEQERRTGSLIQAAFEEAQQARLRAPDGNSNTSGSGARYHQFLAPRKGMSSWIAATVNRLQSSANLQSGRTVTRLTREADTWRVEYRDRNGGVASAVYDRVIATLPAPACAELMAPLCTALGDELRGIPYAGSSVVVAAYPRAAFAVQPTGFGMVVPAVEGRRIIAVSYSSEKFPDRAPPDEVLLRVFVGGALQPELARLPDDELLALTRAELQAIYGLRGEPRCERIVRWEGAMPQYHLGHLERVARIEVLTAALPGLALAGAAYRGVGIPQCIHSGESAAERVLGCGPVKA